MGDDDLILFEDDNEITDAQILDDLVHAAMVSQDTRPGPEWRTTKEITEHYNANHPDQYITVHVMYRRLTQALVKGTVERIGSEGRGDTYWKTKINVL